MHVGIFAKVFARVDLDETLRLIVAHGIRHTQFNLSCLGLDTVPDHLPSDLPTRIRASFDRHGMRMAAVSGTFNLIHPDPAMVDMGLKRLGVLATACRPMGTDLITLCTGTRDPDDMWRRHPDNDTPAAWRDLLRAVERAVEIAEAEDVCLGIEPEQANVINSASKARRLLDDFRSDRLRIVLDPANLIEWGDTSEVERVVEDAFDLLGNAITLAHAKDRDADGRFVAAGRGVLNYDHYIAHLRRIHYRGALVLHGLSEAEVEPSVRFLRNKLDTA